MKGRILIDSVDIYDRYGVTIRKGGYKDLLTFPALKEPQKNDWPEEDGVEVDLDRPVLEVKTVTIPFIAADEAIEPGDFLNFISQPGYRTLSISSLGKEWKLRMTSHTEHTKSYRHTVFSIQFTDDFPQGSRSDNYLPVEEEVAGLGTSVYRLDDVPFSYYGIVVEKGLSNILKAPSIKQNLTRTFVTSDGQVYDATVVVFNSKEVTLKSIFVTQSPEQFWECYTAFFNDLIKPGERQLYCDYTGEEYPCYYKRSGNFQIEQMEGRFICLFDLTLEFTSFRISETEYLLTTEDDNTVTLPDGETAIDMQIFNT